VEPSPRDFEFAFGLRSRLYYQDGKLFISSFGFVLSRRPPISSGQSCQPL
jgi:hypothetical protein